MDLVFPMLLFIGGVYTGMTLMACMVAAGRADSLLDPVTVPTCCNQDCNQGRECPVRKEAA